MSTVKVTILSNGIQGIKVSYGNLSTLQHRLHQLSAELGCHRMNVAFMVMNRQHNSPDYDVSYSGRYTVCIPQSNTCTVVAFDIRTCYDESVYIDVLESLMEYEHVRISEWLQYNISPNIKDMQEFSSMCISHSWISPTRLANMVKSNVTRIEDNKGILGLYDDHLSMLLSYVGMTDHDYKLYFCEGRMTLYTREPIDIQRAAHKIVPTVRYPYLCYVGMSSISKCYRDEGFILPKDVGKKSVKGAMILYYMINKSYMYYSARRNKTNQYLESKHIMESNAEYITIQIHRDRIYIKKICNAANLSSLMKFLMHNLYSDGDRVDVGPSNSLFDRTGDMPTGVPLSSKIDSIAIARCTYVYMLKDIVLDTNIMMMVFWLDEAVRSLSSLNEERPYAVQQDHIVQVNVAGTSFSVTLADTSHPTLSLQFGKDIEFQLKSVIIISGLDDSNNVNIVDMYINMLVCKYKQYEQCYGEMVRDLLGSHSIRVSNKLSSNMSTVAKPNPNLMRHRKNNDGDPDRKLHQRISEKVDALEPFPQNSERVNDVSRTKSIYGMLGNVIARGSAYTMVELLANTLGLDRTEMHSSRLVSAGHPLGSLSKYRHVYSNRQKSGSMFDAISYATGSTIDREAVMRSPYERVAITCMLMDNSTSSIEEIRQDLYDESKFSNISSSYRLLEEMCGINIYVIDLAPKTVSLSLSGYQSNRYVWSHVHGAPTVIVVVNHIATYQPRLGNHLLVLEYNGRMLLNELDTPVKRLMERKSSIYKPLAEPSLPRLSPTHQYANQHGEVIYLGYSVTSLENASGSRLLWVSACTVVRIRNVNPERTMVDSILPTLASPSELRYCVESIGGSVVAKDTRSVWGRNYIYGLFTSFGYCPSVETLDNEDMSFLCLPVRTNEHPDEDRPSMLQHYIALRSKEFSSSRQSKSNIRNVLNTISSNTLTTKQDKYVIHVLDQFIHSAQSTITDLDPW